MSLRRFAVWWVFVLATMEVMAYMLTAISYIIYEMFFPFI